MIPPTSIKKQPPSIILEEDKKTKPSSPPMWREEFGTPKESKEEIPKESEEVIAAIPSNPKDDATGIAPITQAINSQGPNRMKAKSTCNRNGKTVEVVLQGSHDTGTSNLAMSTSERWSCSSLSLEYMFNQHEITQCFLASVQCFGNNFWSMLKPHGSFLKLYPDARVTQALDI